MSVPNCAACEDTGICKGNGSNLPDVACHCKRKPKGTQDLFVVVAFGYWGKGSSIEAAALACCKAGAKASDALVVRLFHGVTPEQAANIYCDNCGGINYPQELDCIRIISPQDGHHVTISALLRGKKKA